MSRWSRVAALLVTLTLSRTYVLAQTRDEIVVIVNKTNPVASLSRDDLRPIFQTRKTTWADGSPIVALDLPADAPVRKGFSAAVLGLDPDRVARFWIDRKIRGGERPPAQLPSSASIVAMVSKHKSAIGYVNVADLTPGVKVVARIVEGRVSAP